MKMMIINKRNIQFVEYSLVMSIHYSTIDHSILIKITSLIIVESKYSLLISIELRIYWHEDEEIEILWNNIDS